jgi:O-antigen ligase
MMNSIYSFSEFGGINTRETQYAEAFSVFLKSPIFGIGDRMFIPTSFQLFPKGIMSYFPEDVHNGFFLFIIERGLLGFTAYVFFMILLCKKITNSQANKEIKSVIYSGLIAGFTMMAFHPERNFLSDFVLLVVVFANFNYEKRITNKA